MYGVHPGLLPIYLSNLPYRWGKKCRMSAGTLIIILIIIMMIIMMIFFNKPAMPAYIHISCMKYIRPTVI